MMLKLKEQFLCKALDRFKEMISHDECSKTDINYFCDMSKYELERRGASIDKRQWITKEEACRMLEVSSSTFDRIVKREKLPRGKKIMKQKALLWKSDEVEQLKKKMMLSVK